jgi:DNA-binding GntR family transcriptional regulator
MGFTGHDDVIDSRDVIEYLGDHVGDRVDDGDLSALSQAFHDEFGGASGWDYGEQIIADHHFTEYTRQLVDDVYRLPSEWPFRCIDWEQAARELQSDYTPGVVDGVTYWVRY